MAALSGLLFMAAGAACHAADRVRMVDNGAEVSVKDCVRAAAQAISEENLDAFIGCFAKKAQPRIRREAAILFVTHALTFELLDTHLVEEQPEKAALAVKYRFSLSENAYEVVSLVGLVREEEAWRIAREKIASRTFASAHGSTSATDGQVFRLGGGGEVMLNPRGDDMLPVDIGRRRGGGCANGRCGL